MAIAFLTPYLAWYLLLYLLASLYSVAFFGLGIMANMISQFASVVVSRMARIRSARDSIALVWNCILSQYSMRKAMSECVCVFARALCVGLTRTSCTQPD
jgi:hypothetical protein